MTRVRFIPNVIFDSPLVSTEDDMNRVPSSIDAIRSKAEVGSFAEETHAAPRTPPRLVVATYNIRYAVGAYLISGSLLRRVGVRRPSRRAKLIERHLNQAAAAFTTHGRMPSVDILALQEADARTVRSGGHHIAPELAARLRFHYAFARMNTPRNVPEQPKKWYLDFEEHITAEDTGDTGVALLSRLPFVEITRLDLPWDTCPWRPRLGVYAVFRAGETALHVFNAHIDTHASTNAQLRQHETILARAESHARRGEPTIILGDFNTLTRAAGVQVRNLLESRGFTTEFPTGTTTWRAGLIRLHTDWIFTQNLRVTRSGVLRPLGVSDHFPVWIEIDSSGF